jgi:hypothetical protein
MKNFLIEIFLLPLKFYRKFVSPLIPPRCKYYPTCSTYALGAVRRFGIIKGSWLALKRVVRCNPWSLGGIDPVPEEYSYFEKWRKKSACK